LAARIGRFQIVVAGADQEQATTKVDQKLEWSSQEKASAFVAVHAPFFNTQEQKEVLNPGFIHAKPKGDNWTLESHTTYKADIIDKERDGSGNLTREVTTASEFHKVIDRELKK